MKRLILLFLLITFYTQAQTGIGTSAPHASAKLEVNASNKGFLPPRVTLTSVSDATTIASPAEGLLVYNLGSVGLQAGYYYWNGANWATIATATSAGNGVMATDMVKLYGEAYSTASGKIANTNGYSFTVPVSGRYLFDFNSTAFSASTFFTINFKVRQGTTDLGTDSHTSVNNDVRVEYDGKVEVNLVAGTTYNVYVTGGSRNQNDYDRVYYKMVAGNLPVTGQSVEYGIARYTGADTGPLLAGALVGFDAAAAGNLTWSGNKFTLKANKTYELESSLAIYHATAGVAGRFQIYDYTNSVALANGLFMSQNGYGANNPNANSPMKGVVTPATDIQVGVRLVDFYGPGGPGIIGNTLTVGSNSAPNASYFIVEQIGSSAFVNPWILSGNNTFNTTGNVGIGTSTPTTTLDVTGNVNVTGKINLTDPTGNVVTKAAAFVARGEDVILGNLKVRLPATGNNSIQVSSVSGTFSIYGSTLLVAGGAAGFSISGASPLVVTTTPAYLRAGANFTDSGWSDMWIIRDTSNSAVWRLTHLPGVNNTNFISIERLL